MRRPFGWLLVVALLIGGCRTGPSPADKAGQPPGVSDRERPPTSTPPTSLPAKNGQLPDTTPAVLPPPVPPTVVIEPAQVLQGNFAILQFDRAVKGDVTVAVTGLSEQPRLFRLEGRPVAFVGFPANARTGPYPVAVTWPGGSWAGKVEVMPKRFTEDRLVVTEEQKDLYYDPRQEAEWKKVFQVRSQSAPRPLWQGPFRTPLAGEPTITTYFGEIRFVNGVETGRHSGMDFGAETGTPILAPARGKVVLAERLIVTGWTIIIDHGLNLYTTYYHCDRVDVSPGSWVEPEAQIGTVGSTGFSTGPHLHWTATIGNTPVDPWPLTQGALPAERPSPERKE